MLARRRMHFATRPDRLNQRTGQWTERRSSADWKTRPTVSTAGLQLVGERLSELLDLGPDHEGAVRLAGIVEVVVLMVLLGRIEDGEGGDLGDDASGEGLRFVE